MDKKRATDQYHWDSLNGASALCTVFSQKWASLQNSSHDLLIKLVLFFSLNSIHPSMFLYLSNSGGLEPMPVTTVWKGGTPWTSLKSVAGFYFPCQWKMFSAQRAQLCLLSPQTDSSSFKAEHDYSSSLPPDVAPRKTEERWGLCRHIVLESAAGWWWC